MRRPRSSGMTWRSIRLGATISLRSRSLGRVAVIAATAVAVLFLCLASALPQMISDRAERAEARLPRTEFLAENSVPYAQVSSRLTLPDGNEATTFLVAPGNAPVTEVPPPPGVEQLPTPGTYVASPGLQKLLESGEVTLPGTPVGTVGNEGLRYPDEPVAWVGVEQEALNLSEVAYASALFTPMTTKTHGFGHSSNLPTSQYQIYDLDLDNAVKALLLVCALLAALPCLIAATTASSLIARQRYLSLNKLVSSGISHRTSRIIAATETLYIQVTGWISGVLGAMLLSPLLRLAMPAEARWFASELTIFSWPVFCVAIGSIAWCTLSAYRQRTTPHVSRKRSVAAWSTGICLILAAWLLRDALVDILRGSPLYVGIAGLALCALSLRGTISFLTAAIAHRITRRSPAALLAGTRLESEHVSASRGPAAVGLAILATSLTTVITTQLTDYLVDVSRLNGPGTLVSTNKPEHIMAQLPNGIPLHDVDKTRVLIGDCPTLAQAKQVRLDCDPGNFVDIQQVERPDVLPYPIHLFQSIFILLDRPVAPHDANLIYYPELSPEQAQELQRIDPLASVDSKPVHEPPSSTDAVTSSSCTA
ncbi:hypothetical protein MHT86_08330 [Corynebacterium mastitidis]|nr:hypothetical protein [Corynebacterium mastitidis]MCH6197501.1 hypothetical protein [Corynebacterium mastitidis]